MSEFASFIDDAPNSTIVVFLKGTADIATHDDFQKGMEEAAKHAAKNVVLDIRHLGFITSLAVGEFLKLYHAKKSVGGKVVIAGPNPYITGVFAAARIGKVVTILPTVEEALAECHRQG